MVNPTSFLRRALSIADTTSKTAAPPPTTVQVSELRPDAVSEVTDLFAHVQKPAIDHLPSWMIKEVPVVPRGDGRLLYIDAEALADSGFRIGHYGRLTPEDEQSLLQAIAIRPAKPGEIATHTAKASRYTNPPPGDSTENAGGFAQAVQWLSVHVRDLVERARRRLGLPQGDSERARRFGLPQGDGRSGNLGPSIAVPVRDGVADAVRFLEARCKGFPTGLTPEGVPAGDGHGSGKIGEAHALGDAVMTAYEAANGLDVPRIPVVVGTDERYDYFFVLGGKKYDFTSRAGFLLLVGVFDRLAHLEFAKEDLSAVRRILDDVGAQVALALGRKHPLSHAGLLQWIIENSAHQLADLWWARTVHGSTTYDNFGLVQMLDNATAAMVNRSHPDYRPIEQVSRGMAHEAHDVLGVMTNGALFEFFRSVARPEEQGKLDMLAQGRDGYRVIDLFAGTTLMWRMAGNTLEHLGLDDDMVRTLCKHDRRAVYELFVALKELAHAQVMGATHFIGNSEKDVVKDPARYDVFAGLGAVARVAADGGTEEEQVTRLVQALAPLAPDDAIDRPAARKLLRAAQPVLERALSGVEGSARDEKLNIIADEAERVNTPVSELAFFGVRDQIEEMANAVHAGKMSATLLNAKLHALVRRNIRRGPKAANAVAMKVRHALDGQSPSRQRGLRTDERGRMELSRIEQNGVLIRGIL